MPAWRSTSASTLVRVAPSAMRTPISRVRCATRYAITPYRPAAVSASATRGKRRRAARGSAAAARSNRAIDLVHRPDDARSADCGRCRLTRGCASSGATAGGVAGRANHERQSREAAAQRIESLHAAACTPRDRYRRRGPRASCRRRCRRSRASAAARADGLDPLADRILVGPVPARGRLVDDHDAAGAPSPSRSVNARPRTSGMPIVAKIAGRDEPRMRADRNRRLPPSALRS